MNEKIEYRSIIEHILFAIVFSIIIYIIIFIKISNISWRTSLVYSYTFLITLFMLSRIGGSFLYKDYHAQNKISKNYEPTVSFVVPCKNEEKAIYKTIKKCLGVNYPMHKLEVITINDGSDDNTLNEMLRFKKENPNLNLKIINFKENKGKREGMCAGFKFARGEIVIQVDSDSYPAKNSIKKIVAPFIDKNIGATVGHTIPENKNKNILTKMQMAYYFVSFRAMKATESIFDKVFCCSGCFSAYRRDFVLPKLDSWAKERFMGKKIIFGDDRALTNVILKQGYKTIYISEALAYTIVPESIRKFLKQQVRWKKGWFINSIRIMPWVIKNDKFVAFTYLIPQTLIAFATPFIAFKALVINPIFFGISPLIYITGIYLISIMLYIHYSLYQKGERKYGKYILLWSTLNLTLLSYIILYAVYDLRNMSWGTR